MLGRVDIQPKGPVFADYVHLFVPSLARCAASRLEKRLDMRKIVQKHHSYC